MKQYSNLNELYQHLVETELDKNKTINYFVRCLDIKDGEQYQILDKDDYILENDMVLSSLLVWGNNIIKKAIINGDDDCYMLDIVAESIKPYISFPELYQHDFDTWEHLVCGLPGLIDFEEINNGN